MTTGISIKDVNVPSTDADLIAAARQGEAEAFGRLYSRHVASARRLAGVLAEPGSSDVPGLVAEAFVKLLTALREGDTPQGSFRMYLLNSIRNIHEARLARNSPPQVPDETHDSYVARAFAKLPERWQTVLWHTEVEGEPHAEVATLLGLDESSVSTLAYRARERLRHAFLSEHLTDSAEKCRWSAERLAAYAQGGLADQDAAEIRRHVKKCSGCTFLYHELVEVNTGIRGMLAPVVLGAAAAAYLGITMTDVAEPLQPPTPQTATSHPSDTVELDTTPILPPRANVRPPIPAPRQDVFTRVATWMVTGWPGEAVLRWSTWATAGWTHLSNQFGRLDNRHLAIGGGTAIAAAATITFVVSAGAFQTPELPITALRPTSAPTPAAIPTSPRAIPQTALPVAPQAALAAAPAQPNPLTPTQWEKYYPPAIKTEESVPIIPSTPTDPPITNPGGGSEDPGLPPHQWPGGWPGKPQKPDCDPDQGNSHNRGGRTWGEQPREERPTNTRPRDNRPREAQQANTQLKEIHQPNGRQPAEAVQGQHIQGYQLQGQHVQGQHVQSQQGRKMDIAGYTADTPDDGTRPVRQTGRGAMALDQVEEEPSR